MPSGIPHVATSARHGLLLSAAIAALAVGMASPCVITPAEAACVVTGSGTQTTLQSNDSITCTGAGNTGIQTSVGASSVTVNVGDGTPTSLDGGASWGVGFIAASNGVINVLNQATITSGNGGIVLQAGSNTTVTLNVGSTLGATGVGTTALGVDASNNNTIVVGGTVGSLAPLSGGIGIYNGAANNQVNILSSGVVHTSTAVAIDLNGAGGGTIIDNAGTISSASNLAFHGSTNQDTVVNSGTIMTSGSTAVNLADGADVFELRAGAAVTGFVKAGSGADTLRFGGATNGTFDLATFGFSSQFQEFEVLEKTGSSTWTLTGITMDATATMNVQAGTLIVNGIMANIATTVSGGTLGGSGVIGSLTMLSGGTVAPGNLGQLVVSGNATFNTGSTFAVSVNAAGQSDKIAAVSATLNGGTVAVTTLAGVYSPSTQYLILSTLNGLSGTFSGVTVSGYNPQLFASGLSYDGFNVYLTLNYNNTAFASIAQTQNQKEVAGALGAFGANLPFLSSFAGLSDAELRYKLDQLSGEAATGARQGAFQFTSQFLGLMLDPFVDGRGDINAGAGGSAVGFSPEHAALPDDIALAYAKVLGAPKAPTFEQRWTAWGAAFGGANRTGGEAIVIGSHDLSARTGGVAAGADYHFSRDALVGFALSGGGTKWELGQAIGGGKSEAMQAGVYTAVRAGPAYVAASLAVANHWMSTDRLAPFGNQLTTRFNAQTVGGRVEGGYRFATPVVGLTPYMAAQAQNFRTPTYTETDVAGSGFGLTYQGRTAYDARGEVGARFDQAALVTSNSILTLRGRVAWAHDWVSDPTLVAAFQALPGASFIVNGATPAKDAALATAGAELKFANGVTLSAKFDGEFAAHSTTCAGTASLRYAW